MPPGKLNWRNNLAIPGFVAADLWVQLAVGPLEVGVGHGRRPPVTWPHDVDRIEVPVADGAVHVGVDEVEARASSPNAREAGALRALV